MALAHLIAPPPNRQQTVESHPLFASIVGEGLSPTAAGRSATLATSIAVHAVLIAAIVVIPLFRPDVLPVPSDAIRAFFVSPPQLAPPPPPPPPPAPSAASAVRRAPVTASTPPPVSAFVAPVDVPEELPMQEQLELSGVEGGVPGGVEGGVPGGVVGGIVGGLPAEPPPPPRVVRVGGNITAPKLLRGVRPEYPMLAQQARLKGSVVLEAHVGTDGLVKDVRTMSGPILLQDAAVAAVKQWRYQPLLLNGQPVEFIVIVTVVFNLYQPTVVQ
jgi:periplasmic protein TonB